MAVNEETRQLEIAHQLVETVQLLAHSTRTIPRPFDPSWAYKERLAQRANA